MILVSGGTGLVGSHLIYKLISQGKKVVAIHRASSDKSKLEHCVSLYSSEYKSLMDLVEWREADLRDIISLEGAFENVTEVYHCAATVSFQSKDKEELIRNNVQSTANIVNIAIQKGVRKLVYTSSIAALGRESEKKYSNEESYWVDSEENSVYSKSKYLAELEVWRGGQEGLDVAIVNPGIILGPADWNEGSSALFKKMYKGLKYYTLGSTGFVDVRDVANVMERLMDSEIVDHRFVLVSKNLGYKDLFVQMADALGVAPPSIEAKKWQSNLLWRIEVLRSVLFGAKAVITKETARSAHSNAYFDNTKVKDLLDFEFIPIEQSIKDTATIFLSENA